ncbi:nucleotidyltransferase domain-containing protein [Candidatus Albibeggiatoa sp. nov. BB20]|uniref:nucleotidyltransferase domain-containing protein n=1 Tax=Candidatus Albibeggiatoa sp. nov. BB20 TaxID=3162723 RepID=UPI003365418E
MSQNTRLNPDIAKQIKKAVFESDADAKVYLFGSRTDLSKKGGDIDILVISKILMDWDAQFAVKRRLFDLIEEQKLDMIFAENMQDDPFVAIISEHAILL